MRSHLYVLQITQADVAIKRRVLQANSDAGFGGVMGVAESRRLVRQSKEVQSSIHQRTEKMLGPLRFNRFISVTSDLPHEADISGVRRDVSQRCQKETRAPKENVY